MKPLLLSFFAVILCYSLFFDKGEEHQKHVDDINYIIRTENYETFRVLDSVPFYAGRFPLKGERNLHKVGYAVFLTSGL
ncbi:MAG: hypothetical protein LBT78_09510 [Tannerella sp.]|jgi:hypothetical protein|nr:hypothetical protein [Tannerella sp.]